MSNDATQKSALLRDFVDGSLSAEQVPDAERLLEVDPSAVTLLNEQDKLETFVGRVREAIAMSNFPEERNDKVGDEVRKAVLEQVQAPVAFDTASVGLNDPSASTDSQVALGMTDSLAFLAPPQAADEIGRLNGYRILRQLGKGGMGLVFEAEDIRLKRRVALKVMKPEIAAKEQHRVRFLREAQTAAQVEHDHICPIYQVGEDNGVPFIAMPFLKGEPLDALLKRQKPLPITAAIRIAREVAEGLAVAHDAGLVHRDIKPANIWLESRTTPHPALPPLRGEGIHPPPASGGGQPPSFPPPASGGGQPPSFPPPASGGGQGGGLSRVRILDFGLARLQTDSTNLTASGAILGTPAYMAPEQARSRPVDHRADLFSLGVMLYEMTTGRRPFTGDDTMSILTSLAVDDPTAPNLINFEVPAELSDLILKLLSKSPNKRPANARIVAETLTAILMRTTRPIVEALPTDSGERRNEFNFDDATNVDVPLATPADEQSPKRKRGRPALFVAAAIALLLLIGGVGAYMLFFETKDGKLIVEVDRDADVRFKNGKLEIYDDAGKLQYTMEPDEKNKTLPPGKYTIKVVGADGLKVNTSEFKLEKGDKTKVYVIVDTSWRPEWAKKEPVAGKPVDLLAMVNPKRDAVHGRWKVVDGKLVGGGDSSIEPEHERLQVLYAPPAEYDLTLLVERTRSVKKRIDEGFSEVLLIWLTGANHFVLALDVSVTRGVKTVNGLDAIDGKGFRNNETTTEGDYFSKSGPVRVTCRVRRDLVVVEIDEKERIRWTGDLRRLTYSHKQWVLPDQRNLAIGLENAEYRIHEWKVTPVGPASADPDRRAAEWVLSIGGTIKINEGGKEREIKAVGDLPKGAFELTVVNLHENPKATDVEMAHFKDCKNLTYLDLYECQVSDAGLAHFKECKNLTYLDLRGTKLSDAAMAHFKNCNSITHLFLDNTQVTDAGLAHFKNCKNLEQLGLAATQVGDAGLAHFQDCKNFTNLYLHGTRVSDAGLGGFKDCKNLAVLFLASTKVTDAGLAHFKNWMNLRQLDLTNTKVSDAGVPNFKDCKYLTNLYLGATQVSDASLAYFKDCKNLTVVSLAQTKVSDAGLAFLRDRKILEAVILSNTQVTDAGLEYLVGCSTLVQVNVKYTKVTEAGVTKLAAALPQCRIDWDGGVIEPQKSPDRKALEWVLGAGGSLQIESNGQLQEIAAGGKLPDRPFAVTILDLSGLPGIDDGAIENFRELPTVRYGLGLGNTRLTDAGLAKVAAIPGFNKIRRLELCGMPITNAGLKSLRQFEQLEKLRLDATPISDSGLEHLTQLPALEVLDLRFNGDRITDGGLVHLAGCKKLNAVNLNATKVTDAGVKKLAAALPGCRIDWDGGVIEPKQSPADAKFVSKEGKYAARFPAKPVEARERDRPVGDLFLRTHTAADGREYRVAYCDYPKDYKPDLQVFFDGIRDDLKGKDGKLVGDKKLEFGADNVPGREIHIAIGPKHLRDRVLWRENRLYHIQVGGSEEFVTGKDADKFLESFEFVSDRGAIEPKK